jgi:RNA polymerase primary sigma factor
MEETDILEEIMDLGSRRGTLTYGEINDALPPEFYSPDDLADRIDLFKDMGINMIDDKDTGAAPEVLGEESEEHEKSEDLVQAYFHSMGHISLLTRDEERELAKKLEKGRDIIKEIITAMPLYKKIEEGLETCEKEEEGEQCKDEQKADQALAVSLDILDNLMRNIDSIVLPGAFRHAESETGVTMDDLKKKWARITKARALYTEAKDELITRNLRLVVNMAKHYVGRGLPFLDLIQEGNIGLMKAVDKFKYDKGCKFSTYATWWIKQAITRALIDQTKTIRVPIHVMEFYGKVLKVSRELTQKLGREASNQEIAGHLGIPASKVEDVYRVMQDTVALQTPVGGEESRLEEFIDDKNSLSPFCRVEKEELSRQMLKILKTLPSKEAKVIKMRFGIGVARDHTLEEVGKQLSITRERVRQIEVIALRRLKHPSRVSALKALIAS